MDCIFSSHICFYTVLSITMNNLPSKSNFAHQCNYFVAICQCIVWQYFEKYMFGSCICPYTGSSQLLNYLHNKLPFGSFMYLLSMHMSGGKFWGYSPQCAICGPDRDFRRTINYQQGKKWPKEPKCITCWQTGWYPTVSEDHTFFKKIMYIINCQNVI